jgi:hypothetical protein
MSCALTRVLCDIPLVGLAKDPLARALEIQRSVRSRRAKVSRWDGPALDRGLEEVVERGGPLGTERGRHGVVMCCEATWLLWFIVGDGSVEGVARIYIYGARNVTSG